MSFIGLTGQGIKCFFRKKAFIITTKAVTELRPMNRRKKINETLKKKAKKMNAKRNPKNKPKYVSKAEREKLASEQDLPTENSESQVDTTAGE